MRMILIVATLAVVVALANPAAATGDPIGGPADDVIHQVQKELRPVDPYCQAILDQGRENGLFPESIGRTEDPHEFEYEWLKHQPACAELRDHVQHLAYGGEMPVVVDECKKTYRTTCLAIGHEACDFALLLGSGLVYFCWDSLNPYN